MLKIVHSTDTNRECHSELKRMGKKGVFECCFVKEKTHIVFEKMLNKAMKKSLSAFGTKMKCLNASIKVLLWVDNCAKAAGTLVLNRALRSRGVVIPPPRAGGIICGVRKPESTSWEQEYLCAWNLRDSVSGPSCAWGQHYRQIVQSGNAPGRSGPWRWGENVLDCSFSEVAAWCFRGQDPPCGTACTLRFQKLFQDRPEKRSNKVFRTQSAAHFWRKL